MPKRVILVVLDSVGIGALPDAAEFSDVGAHTLGNIFAARKKLELPNLYKLGLAKIEDAQLPGLPGPALGGYARAAEKTKAKDTTSGHWELAGVEMETPFRTYPDGFPPVVIEAFERSIGRKTLGNVVASGTEIIQQLGEAHMRTGAPIVYTSVDSVFQVAAHEQVIPLEELYAVCQSARELLVGENLVGRVIARPFIGSVGGGFTRTQNRRDFAIPPVKPTILDALSGQGLLTVGVGKIEDIFCNQGVGLVDHTRNNHDGIEATLRYIREGTGDFIFTNLVDFDMLYGHRNDVEGYAAALEAFDARLPELMGAMAGEDMLIITADHGCDPVFPGTDHTREYIPVLVWGKQLQPNVNLGTLNSFADIAATVYEYLCGGVWNTGQSFLSKIKL